jgi:hypothetical protein
LIFHQDICFYTAPKTIYKTTSLTIIITYDSYSKGGNKMAGKKPKYDLDKIVGDLDPGKINKEVEIKHREARNKYSLKSPKVEGYDKLMKETIAYLKHHHKEVYKSDLPDHMISGMARQLLDEAFKKKGGIAGAQSEAKNGHMDRVLNAVADALESQERSNYVTHVFNQIDPQDFDGHVEIVDQYKSKFGSLLPKDMKQKSSEELAHAYDQLIDHHVGIVEQAKSTLKKYKPKGEELKKAA